MAHSITGRLMTLIVAGLVVVAATITAVPPRPVASVTAVPTSTQAVALTAADLNIGDLLEVLPKPIVQAIAPVLAGPLAGVVIGFFAAGVLALNVLSNIPGVGQALAPLVPVIAVAGAIIGAPIGLVAGPIIALANAVSGAVRQLTGAAAVSASPASARAASKPNHRTVKPPAVAHREAAVPQQRSGSGRAGSGRDRDAASRQAGRH